MTPAPGTIYRKPDGRTRTVISTHRDDLTGEYRIRYRRSEEPDRVAVVGLVAWGIIAQRCTVVTPETAADAALAVDPGVMW